LIIIAPEDVPAPKAISDTDALAVMWEEPGKPDHSNPIWFHLEQRFLSRRFNVIVFIKISLI
jgi:hypothetical protein